MLLLARGTGRTSFGTIATHVISQVNPALDTHSNLFVTPPHRKHFGNFYDWIISLSQPNLSMVAETLLFS